jgi:hypothetical protein
VFARVWDAAHADAAATISRHLPILPSRASIPYLTEPWYC